MPSCTASAEHTCRCPLRSTARHCAVASCSRPPRRDRGWVSSTRHVRSSLQMVPARATQSPSSLRPMTPPGEAYVRSWRRRLGSLADAACAAVGRDKNTRGREVRPASHLHAAYACPASRPQHEPILTRLCAAGRTSSPPSPPASTPPPYPPPSPPLVRLPLVAAPLPCALGWLPSVCMCTATRTEPLPCCGQASPSRAYDGRGGAGPCGRDGGGGAGEGGSQVRVRLRGLLSAAAYRAGRRPGARAPGRAVDIGPVTVSLYACFLQLHLVRCTLKCKPMPGGAARAGPTAGPTLTTDDWTPWSLDPAGGHC